MGWWCENSVTAADYKELWVRGEEVRFKYSMNEEDGIDPVRSGCQCFRVMGIWATNRVELFESVFHNISAADFTKYRYQEHLSLSANNLGRIRLNMSTPHVPQCLSALGITVPDVALNALSQL
jgi:hypothetical protein